MQLILNTDSTVTIKSKMSLSEENLGNCVVTANGDLPNGDVLKENIDINIKDGKLAQLQEIGHSTTDGECNQEVADIYSNNIDIEISHTNNKDADDTSIRIETPSDANDKLIDRPTDGVPDDEHQIDSPTCNETDLNGRVQFKVNSENACLDITGEKNVTDDSKAKMVLNNDKCDSSTNAADIDKHTGLTSIEKECDLKYANSIVHAEKSESPVETASGNNKSVAELNDNTVSKTAEKLSATREKENTEDTISSMPIPKGNNIVTDAKDCSGITSNVKETGKTFDDTVDSSMDVDPRDDITKEIDVINNVTENSIVLNEKGDISINSNDNETAVDSTADNTVDESKLKTNELGSKENSVKVDVKIVSEQFTDRIKDQADTSENKSTLDEHILKIAVENKKSDNPNLVNMEDKTEEEIRRSACQIEDINVNTDNLAKSALIETAEAITEKQEETLSVTPVSSDDIIFNLDDDDKDQSLVTKETESTQIIVDDDKPLQADDEATLNSKKDDKSGSKSSYEVIDLDDAAINHADTKQSSDATNEESPITEESKTPVLKLSNTLDILSDEEEDSKDTNINSKTINIEDDDDVMLIDEEISGTESKTEVTEESKKETQVESQPESPTENMEVTVEIEKNTAAPETLPESVPDKESVVPDKEVVGLQSAPEITDKVKEEKTESELKKPLMHENFLKTCKKSLADMTKEELEEFCIVKIVESVLDRSNLSEIRTKLKTMAQSIEEYKKKTLMLTKQNRDLQVVLKSIQEDQKKGTESIVPLKITRSVGMQVLMSDKPVQRRKGGMVIPPANALGTRSIRNPVPQSPRPQKPAGPQIPVPRLVPANSPNIKSPSAPQTNTAKVPSPVPNGVRNPSPVQKGEKRTHNRSQSVTVDLTDDEPPSKVASRGQAAPVPPVRLVPSQNLLAPPRAAANSPRKVYIPISGPQGQNVRPGQTIMLKTVSTPPGGPRPRVPPPHMVRMPQSVRMNRPQGTRHPAPLPDCMKQYQPPNWKALPPAPDLKLAKVENGIVISWKIEGYQEDSYEEIASYQLYAYQETSSPPSTTLWKKIGDVKALPLPMACTLTQFMAGYKYYFAVRAVDVRSRLGPFSLPGSILLLNKM